jgi:magnesium-transporting ATPase (P-type)
MRCPARRREVLHVDAASGLGAEEAERRLAELGHSRLEDEPPEPRWRALAREYGEPMQLVLLVAGTAGLALGQLGTGLALLALTLGDALLGLHREGRPAAPAIALALASDAALTTTARTVGLAAFALMSVVARAITRMRRCADPGAE